jgi:hypothetical protein
VRVEGVVLDDVDLGEELGDGADLEERVGEWK